MLCSAIRLHAEPCARWEVAAAAASQKNLALWPQLSQQRSTEVRERLLDRVYDRELDREPLDVPSLRLRKRISGHPFGEQWVVERTGDSWFSNYQDDSRAVQGNPKWLIEALGPQAALVFGFQQLSSRELLVPSVELLNRAIEEINRRLPSVEAIPLSFYPQLNANKDYYNRMFALRGALPVGPPPEIDASAEPMQRMATTNRFIHDLSFHSSAILLPPRTLEILRIHAGLILQGFEQSSKGFQNQHPNRVSENQRALQKMHLDLSTELDLVLGQQWLTATRLFSQAEMDAQWTFLELSETSRVLSREWSWPSLVNKYLDAHGFGWIYRHPLQARELRRGLEDFNRNHPLSSWNSDLRHLYRDSWIYAQRILKIQKVAEALEKELFFNTP